MTEELPEETVDEAERLSRLARRAVDESEAAAYRERRAELLDAHDFVARVRRAGEDETLVCHPAEWVEDGTVRTDRIEDTDRAVEVPLTGAGDPDDWAAVDERNREIAAQVRAEHGDVHGDTAAALADFMSNHYAKPIPSASAEELEEFRTEYFPRNAWPSDEQQSALDRSLRRCFEAAGVTPPR
ncbi:MAG: rnhA operon protein [Halobacteriaceae archaeon]